MDDRATRESTADPASLGLLVMGFCVFNLLIPRWALHSNAIAWLTIPFIGVTLAQFGLAAAWGVFAPRCLLLRLTSSLALGAGLSVQFLVGLPSARSPNGEDALRVLMLLPLLLLAVQTPLWILKFVSGARISPGKETAGKEEETARQMRQFSLQEILTATAWVAVALGSAQMALRWGGNMPFALDGGWSSLAVTCGVLALWSTLVLLPCIWGLLIARDPWAGTGAMLAYQLVLTLMVAPVLLALVSYSEPVGLMFLAMFVLPLFQLGCVGTLLGCLVVVRRGGYSWHRPSDATRDEHTVDSAPLDPLSKDDATP